MTQMGQDPHTGSDGQTGLFSRLKAGLVSGARILGAVLEKRADARAQTYGAIAQQFTGKAPQGGGLSGLKPLHGCASVFQRGATAANPRAENIIAAIEAAMQAREKAGRSPASNRVIGK